MTKRVLIGVLVILTLLISRPRNINNTQSTTISPTETVKVVEDIEEVTEDVRPKTVILSTNKVIEIINIRLSFYTDSYTDCLKTDGISASGKHLPTLSRGGIQPVAAPKDVKFGQNIYITNIGYVQVEDRGGAIKWEPIKGVKYMKVDVFIPNATEKQIRDMGVIFTKGYFIEEDKDEDRINN